MSKVFPNPAKHPEWIVPHSTEWYNRIASDCGEYGYPWKSEFDEPTAETIFGQKISACINETSRVLDIGCGHGEFLNKWAPHAGEAVGIDNQSRFIATAQSSKSAESLRFLTVDVSEGLPFGDQYFDVIFSKKGPWLFADKNREGNRVIKPGGKVFQLIHGSTDGGMRALFPGLYFASAKPWDREKAVQKVYEEHQLSESRLSDIEIQVIEETEYLSTPEDLLIKKCFGQSKRLKDDVWRECLSGVAEIFHKHAGSRGLKVTNYYFLISGVAF